MSGQNSATASFTASVTIIEPVEIQNISDMNFANIDARQGGIVILNPDNSRSTIGDVKLDDSNTVSAAMFEVKGQNGYAYDVSIPQGEFIMQSGTSSIVIRDFTLANESQSFNSIKQTLRLGASIEIEARQKPGIYVTPAPLEVTISYN